MLICQLGVVTSPSHSIGTLPTKLFFSSFCNDWILGPHWALSITITHEAWLGPDGCNCPLCNVHNDSRAISDRRLSDFGGCREGGGPSQEARGQRRGVRGIIASIISQPGAGE